MKRWTRAFAIVLALILALNACAQPAPTTPAAPEAQPQEKAPAPTAAAEAAAQPAKEAEPVTLRIMNWSQEQADFYQEVAAEFQKEYPWITIQWETMAQQQYKEALPLMFRSGESPDIFFWIGRERTLTMAELLDQGWIRPLTPDGSVPEEWMARWGKGAFLEGINIHEGQVYSFPFNDNLIWGPGYMFINREVFRAAGLDPDNPPKTWNALYEACKTIMEKAGTYCLAIPLKGTDLQRTWYPIAGSIMTDRFFDYKNGRFAIDDPKLLQAFNFIKKLYDENLVVPGVNDKTFARQAMASGQAAIYFGGAWMPSVFQAMGFTDLELGVAPPPYPDDGPRGALSRGQTENKFWVSSQTQHPEEAWLFIEWMTRPDGFFAQEYLKRGFGTLAFADNKKYIQDPVMQKIADIAPDLRVMYPEPVVACPDVARSKAYLEAENYHPNWEFEAMVEALTTGTDFEPVAQEIAAMKNKIFQETLEKEQAEGLQVSMTCWSYPEWDYNQDFDPELYANHRP
ncbi:MAG: hypothetical protein Kow0047_17980 [Anaerolineae bacterium]